MPAEMEILFEEFPCRKVQINTLHGLLGEEDEFLPGSIFLYGPPAVGKTGILLRYLELTKANYSLVNCIECYTHKLLFESLLNRLNVRVDRCDTFMDFVHLLKTLREKGCFKSRTLIVLDGIEKLLDLSEHYFSAFCKLQELTSIYSLSVVFISCILLEKFNTDSSIISIHFPQYNKDELLQILERCKPPDYSQQFYNNYLNAVLNVFLRATRDLNEMKTMVSISFKKYCEPIESGEIQKDDVGSLWRHIVPYLKDLLNTVYLRTNLRSHNASQVETSSDELIVNTKTSAMDLPYYAKYFLIAAYLASYNSPKYDKRLFVKHHGKERKKLERKNVKGKLGAELLGPKAFSLDRLLAIFYSIMEDKASLTANLMVQIKSLVELRLLVILTEGNLDKPKYKCFVDFQCVNEVARTLGFNIRKYLMD